MIQKSGGKQNTLFKMEQKEARYETAKGIIERNHGSNPSKFTDEELVVVFKVPADMIPRFRKEFDKTLDNEMDFKYRFLKSMRLKEYDQASEMIVKDILSKEHIYTTKDDQKSEVWIYREGIYVPNGKTEVKEIMRNMLEEVFCMYHYNLVIAKIEADTYISPSEFFDMKYKYEIPVKNGILNILTKELTPFSPDKIFFTKIPVEYNPDSKCEKIDKFLSDILSKPEDKNVFYEMGGFSLMKEYTFEKAFMLVGDGRNGKGKCLQLLKRTVGVENCSSVPLSSLSPESFQISELFGKMVNLAGDIGRTDLKDTSMFKGLTGRDPVNGKRKFLRDINFENYAKMIFACNELPMVYDMSKGFWDRWVLLEFPYTFEDKDTYYKEKDNPMIKLRDDHIIDKISEPEELSGLLNKFLEGLNRLIDNGRFSITQGTEEIKNLWIRKSNSFVAFCMDKLEEDYDSTIKKKDMRKEYMKYCKEHKIPGKSDYVIKVTLQEMFGVTDERKVEFGNPEAEWHWVGVKYKGDIIKNE